MLWSRSTSQWSSRWWQQRSNSFDQYNLQQVPIAAKGMQIGRSRWQQQWWWWVNMLHKTHPLHTTDAKTDATKGTDTMIEAFMTLPTENMVWKSSKTRHPDKHPLSYLHMHSIYTYLWRHVHYICFVHLMGDDIKAHLPILYIQRLVGIWCFGFIFHAVSLYHKPTQWYKAKHNQNKSTTIHCKSLLHLHIHFTRISGTNASLLKQPCVGTMNQKRKEENNYCKRSDNEMIFWKRLLCHSKNRAMLHCNLNYKVRDTCQTRIKLSAWPE